MVLLLNFYMINKVSNFALCLDLFTTHKGECKVGKYLVSISWLASHNNWNSSMSLHWLARNEPNDENIRNKTYTQCLKVLGKNIVSRSHSCGCLALP